MKNKKIGINNLCEISFVNRNICFNQTSETTSRAIDKRNLRKSTNKFERRPF